MKFAIALTLVRLRDGRGKVRAAGWDTSGRRGHGRWPLQLFLRSLLAILPLGGELAVRAAAVPVALKVDTTQDLLGSTATCSAPPAGKCSLRKAIALANASTGGTSHDSRG